MPSQDSGLWSKSESERLVAWMEENQEELRGKQITWHKLVKEQVLSSEEQITAFPPSPASISTTSQNGA